MEKNILRKDLDSILHDPIPLFGWKVPVKIKTQPSGRENACLAPTGIQICMKSVKDSKLFHENKNELLEKLLRSLLQEMLLARLEKFSQLGNFSYKEVRIKKMISRWGSCSEKKNLNFNLGLALIPVPVLDYVVVHELCHLRHLNHSKDFWKEVENLLPDYKTRRKWLRENETSVLNYLFSQKIQYPRIQSFSVLRKPQPDALPNPASFPEKNIPGTCLP